MSSRFCVPDYDGSLFSYEGGKASGYVAEFFNEFIPLFQARNTSAIIAPDKFGDVIDRKTLRYDGCIGQLQQNKMDIAMIPTNFPVIAPNITNGAILFSTTISIVSGYNSSLASAKTDVMEFFTAFDSILWLMILTLIVALISIQITSIRIRSKRRSVLRWIQNLSTSASLKQFSSLNITSRRFTVRLVHLMIIIFVFETHFFLTSMIKTEMVVQKEPETISTYEEIVQRPNCKPMWLRAASTHWEFKNSDPESPAGKIWKRGVSLGLENCFFRNNPENPSDGSSVAKGESVLFLPSAYFGIVSSNACGISRSYGFLTDLNIWSRTDATAKEQLQVLIRSSHVPREAAQLLDLAVKRVLEHGMMPKLLQLLEFITAKDVATKSEVRDCMANQILFPEHVLESMNLSHYSGLWKLVAVPFSLAGILFFVSMLTFWWNRMIRTMPQPAEN